MKWTKLFTMKIDFSPVCCKNLELGRCSHVLLAFHIFGYLYICISPKTRIFEDYNTIYIFGFETRLFKISYTTIIHTKRYCGHQFRENTCAHSNMMTVSEQYPLIRRTHDLEKTFSQNINVENSKQFGVYPKNISVLHLKLFHFTLPGDIKFASSYGMTLIK